jgi:hypothetical protein
VEAKTLSAFLPLPAGRGLGGGFLYDPDAFNETEEPDWLPPPPPPDPWNRWQRRVAQVGILHAIGVGFPAILGLAAPIPRQVVLGLLLCAVPALTLTWFSLIAYFVTRAREKSGTRSDRGRMLVLFLDVLTAVFVMIGFGFWIAVLTRS